MKWLCLIDDVDSMVNPVSSKLINKEGVICIYFYAVNQCNCKADEEKFTIHFDYKPFKHRHKSSLNFISNIKIKRIAKLWL